MLDVPVGLTIASGRGGTGDVMRKGHQDMERYDTVVVGGGIAGLIAACDLRSGGARVLLLEAAREIGGRARTRNIEGYSFNLGPHALYLKGAFCAALDDLKIPRPGRPPVFKKPTTLWSDQKHPLPVGLLALLRLTPLNFADRWQAMKLLGKIDRGDYEATGQSLRAYSSHLRPRVQMLLEALARLSTYANAPDDIDAQAVLDQIRLSFGGVHYVDDGWGPIAEAIARLAQTGGAELRLGCRASGILRDADGWRIFAEGHEDLRADTVILATEPAISAKLHQRSSFIEAAAARAIPARAVCLDIALSKLMRPDEDFALGVDEPIYYSIHSTAARLAPEGGGLIHAARYLAPGEKPLSAHVDRLERLFDLLQPGWQPFEVHRQRLLGMSVTHDIPQARMGGRRTPAAVPDAAGLFLAGDWIGNEGMLSDAAAASGRHAALCARTYLAGGQLRPVEAAE